MFTRLISNQMRRLLYNAPRAMSSMMAPNPAAVGRRVLGPATARPTAARTAAHAPRNATFSTRSSNRSRVSRARTSTDPPSRGQWSINATKPKSNSVEYATSSR